MENRLMKPWKELHDNERFLQYYVCLNFTESQAHHQLDNSNKVILPVSALDRLMKLRVDFPLMFNVQNPNDATFFEGGATTHCGVYEFTAEEGYVHMPRRMMRMLGLEEGHLVFFTNSFPLAKGTMIKIQPHKTEFLSLSDPKTVLEIALRSYSCLTTGDVISIVHDTKEYLINIVETFPEPAIDILDTDCEVDFEAPVDYDEVMKKTEPPKKKKAKVAEEGEKSKFFGTARRLDGSTVPPPPPEEEEEAEETKQCGRKSGTIVFGSSTKPDKNKEPASSKKQEKEQKATVEVEPVKFQAFTGQKRTIM